MIRRILEAIDDFDDSLGYEFLYSDSENPLNNYAIFVSSWLGNFMPREAVEDIETAVVASPKSNSSTIRDLRLGKETVDAIMTAFERYKAWVADDRRGTWRHGEFTPGGKWVMGKFVPGSE